METVSSLTAPSFATTESAEGGVGQYGGSIASSQGQSMASILEATLHHAITYITRIPFHSTAAAAVTHRPMHASARSPSIRTEAAVGVVCRDGLLPIADIRGSVEDSEAAMHSTDQSGTPGSTRHWEEQVTIYQNETASLNEGVDASLDRFREAGQ